MSEVAVRLALVGLAVVLIAGAGWWSSYSRRARGRPFDGRDLAPGVYLFSSATCTTCRGARRVLDHHLLRYSEVRFEDDPSALARHAIGSVPTVVVVTREGATAFEGVPRWRALARVGAGLFPDAAPRADP